jgi:hypothetical protein
MVGGFLAYGVPVTGKFGDPRDIKGLKGQLKAWMKKLQDCYPEEDLDPDNPDEAAILDFYTNQLASCPTAESTWYVAGFPVNTKNLSEPAYYNGLRGKWDEMMAELPADVLQNLLDLGGPGFHVLCGKY